MALVKILASFQSKCEACGEWIQEDDEILWDPEERVAYHRECDPND